MSTSTSEKDQQADMSKSQDTQPCIDDQERERKRSKDRLYQRRKRQRDKERLAKLQERVDAIDARKAASAANAATGPTTSKDPVPASPDSDDESSMLVPTSPSQQVAMRQTRGTPESVWENLEGKYEEVVSRADHTSSDVFSLPSAANFDSHVIISAVLHGWDQTFTIFTSDAVWKTLRHVDETILLHCGVIERLSALRTIAMLLRSQHSPDVMSQLPSYLWPRPSQLSVPHPKIVDTFIWPGFRERMVFQHGQYTSNEFAKLYIQSYKFAWPTSTQAAFTKVPNTPLYTFTDSFITCWDDVRSHRMDYGFLSRYPAFHGDCPVVGSIPMGLQVPTTSYSWDCEWVPDDEHGLAAVIQR
ncbi:hypothetical protein NQ176_g5703 [Zarea fungicola]|uniref:Uncharacterized protein n=1 Tax=Zarea fungicola TaxID=93591 RepID=A0ACC1N8B1_9HYPO|nr:hypothetical protein NQ176_g5703 [Lecanicillium fungicola]